MTAGTVSVNNGGSVPWDYTVSPEGVSYNFSPGACMVYGMGGGYFNSNLIQVYYVTQPGGGTLTMSLNKEGAGWIQVGTANTAGAQVGAVWQYDAGTASRYMLQVCATGGNAIVYTVGQIDTTHNGIVIEGFGRGGLKIADYTSTPKAITDPWDAVMHPTLVNFKMDSNGLDSTFVPPNCNYTNDAGTIFQPFSYFWAKWSDRWIGSTPLRDVIVDGGYPGGGGCELLQNQVQQQWAAANHKRYLDGYNISGSLANQLALGWLTVADTAHQTVTGQIAQAEIEMQELGLNSLWIGENTNDVVNTNTTDLAITVQTGPVSGNNAAGGIFTATGGDMQLKLTRDFSLQDMNGNEFAKLSAGADSFGNYLPWFHFGPIGPGVCYNSGQTLFAASQSCDSATRFLASGFRVSQQAIDSASGTVAISGAIGVTTINATGNVTYAPVGGYNGGDMLTTRFCQDSVGGRTLSYAANQFVGGTPVNLLPNHCTVQQWLNFNGTISAVSPGIDDLGHVYSN